MDRLSIPEPAAPERGPRSPSWKVWAWRAVLFALSFGLGAWLVFTALWLRDYLPHGGVG